MPLHPTGASADHVEGQVRPPLVRAPAGPRAGGKSGLQRAERRATPGTRTPGPARARGDRECHRKQTSSADLQRHHGWLGSVRAGLPLPLRVARAREGRVKRRGKSPPLCRQRERHGKPRSEQSQAAGGGSPAGRLWVGTLRVGCTRARETAAPREMVVLDRTRLIDLPFFLI